MDLDTVLTLPFVVSVDDRPDGSYGVRFTVPAGGPYPGDITPANNPPGDYTDALTYVPADFETATIDDIALGIAERYGGWLDAVSPQPVGVSERESLLAELEKINSRLAELEAPDEPGA